MSAPPAIDQESDAVIIPNLDGSYQILSIDTIEEISPAAFEPQTEIVYELFTKTSSTKPQFIKIDEVKKLKQSDFKSNRPTIILVHGWLSKGEIREIFRNGNMFL